MRFILFQLTQSTGELSDAEVLRREEDLVVLADELGYDAAWFSEHHFNSYWSISVDPLLVSAHLAARTKRIRLGSAANVATWQHPLRIAEQAALLDILSDGRVDIGLAKGIGWREFAGFGIEMERVEVRFREAVEIIFKAWTEDEVSYDGEHFRFPAMEVRPRPVTRPHPSAYIVTSGSEGTLDLAARFGVPFYFGYSTPEHAAGIVKTFSEKAKEHGRSEDEIRGLLARSAAMMNSHPAATEQAAREDVAAAFEGMRGSTASLRPPRPEGEAPKPKRAPDPEKARKALDAYWHHTLSGAPEQVSERIEEIREAGFENVILGISYGGLPYDRVRASMRVFAEEVMPRFK